MTWCHDIDGATVAFVCAALLVCLRIYVGPTVSEPAGVTLQSPWGRLHSDNAVVQETHDWQIYLENLLLLAVMLWVSSPLAELLYNMANKSIRYLHSAMRSREGVRTDALSEDYGACDSDSGSIRGPSLCELAESLLPVAPAEPGRSPAPASLIQEPMLAWQLLYPQGHAFNEGWCVWLEGSQGHEIATQILRQAFASLLQRHEVLRMKFAVDSQGKWTQQPLMAEPLLANVYQEHPDGLDEEQALCVADMALHKPFQIFDGLCVRAGVARSSSGKVLFYVVQHHSVTDAVSISLLYKEFAVLYRALAAMPEESASNMGALPLPTLLQPDGYAMFSAMQQQNALTGGYGPNLHWWRCHIRGASGSGDVPTLDLPKDHQPRAKPSFDAVVASLDISAELSAGIQALASQESVTVFDVLLALQSSWLCLMSRNDEVLVWTSHHGRADSKTSGLAGCFRTGLPLRCEPHGSFRQFLRTVAQTKREALQRWDVPPGELYNLAKADGIQGSQIILNYYSDRYHTAGIESQAAECNFSAGLRAHMVDLRKRFTQGEVEVTVAKDGRGRLYGKAAFAADLFSQASADRMAALFTTVASAAICNPGFNVLSLPVLTPTQEAHLDTFHGSPSLAALPTVVELLHSCVAVGPTRVAVEYEATGEQLTYEELAARSWGLAAELLKYGLVPDALVALMLERSVEMMVAIHGVWAAGCAYVPMDLSAPSAYHKVIAADVSAHNTGLSLEGRPVPAVLLTQSWLLSQPPGVRASPFPVGSLVQSCFAQVLSLDTFKPHLVSPPKRKPLEGHNLAYCIYTSGSTGRPKGVLVPHCGISNYIHACNTRMEPLGQHDIILQKTPYIFDVSLYEFAMPLLAACKLVLLKHEMHKDVEYLLHAMARCRATRTRFIPSYFDLFLDVARALPMEREALSALRNVGCSGEAMRAETVRSCLQLLPQVALYDLYGPTEASVDVTCLCCTADVLLPGKKTIGRALDGVHIFVANQCPDSEECQESASNALHFRRTPVGLHGELLIGGPQLARGYMNLPERTTLAFIASPFKTRKNEPSTLYRTGDLVKWHPDGQVMFLGRIDRQVKLSGVRIELGDIETAAAQAPGVVECIAKVYVEKDSKQIVLYVVPSSAATAEVLQCCRATLPAYMVPSSVVGIDEWPRTSSGKIDTKQLPPPPSVSEGTGAIDTLGNDKQAAVEMLIEKIKNNGVVSAMADEDVQAKGWNSFQVIQIHAEIMRSMRNPSAHSSIAITPEVGVISIVGHIWFFMMVLVMLEWLVAYWEWYSAVPSMAGRFSVNSYPVLRQLNALGRLCGDPVFILLSGIQDMTDVRDGKTANLVRRALLFIAICVLGTYMDKMLLQGPFVRFGWVSADWALDTTRMCGVLNGASFIFGRAFFMMFSVFLSLGSGSWITLKGFVEWPCACLVLALFIPLLLEGITPVSGFGDGSTWDYVRACKNFIVELTPYYFLYPLFVGGTQFPDWMARKKVQASRFGALAIQASGMVLFLCIWHWLAIESTSDVDVINSQHRTWTSLLRRVEPRSDWPLLNSVKTSFDLYAAAVAGSLCISFALMSPATPTHFSLLGTRVIGAYLTMPLTLIAAGHFVGPVLLAVPKQWQSILVPCGIIAILLLCTILPSQQILPDKLLDWVQNGNLQDIVLVPCSGVMWLTRQLDASMGGVHAPLLQNAKKSQQGGPCP